MQTTEPLSDADAIERARDELLRYIMTAQPSDELLMQLHSTLKRGLMASSSLPVLAAPQVSEPHRTAGRILEGTRRSMVDPQSSPKRLAHKSKPKERHVSKPLVVQTNERDMRLVRLCREMDDKASAELIAEHGRMVMRLAINLLGDRKEAADLGQEVFVRVFRTIFQFRGQSSLRTWIYRIAVRSARHRHRRLHRSNQVSLDKPITSHRNFAAAGQTMPDHGLAQKGLSERLEDALVQLPFDQRTVIVLREVDHLSYEEIAFSLGVTIGAIKSRLTRARQALRLALRNATTE